MLDAASDVRDANDSAILDVVSRACTSVLAHYRVYLRRCVPHADQWRQCLGAVTHLRGPVLRASVFLGASRETLEQLQPSDGVPLGDWITELANQVCGRAATELRDRGVKLATSIPELLPPGGSCPRWGRRLGPLAFESELGTVAYWMNAQWDPSFTLDDPDRTTRLRPAELFGLL